MTRGGGRVGEVAGGVREEKWGWARWSAEEVYGRRVQDETSGMGGEICAIKYGTGDG